MMRKKCDNNNNNNSNNNKGNRGGKGITLYVWAQLFMSQCII